MNKKKPGNIKKTIAVIGAITIACIVIGFILLMHAYILKSIIF